MRVIALMVLVGSSGIPTVAQQRHERERQRERTLLRRGQ